MRKRPVSGLPTFSRQGFPTPVNAKDRCIGPHRCIGLPAAPLRLYQ